MEKEGDTCDRRGCMGVESHTPFYCLPLMGIIPIVTEGMLGDAVKVGVTPKATPSSELHVHCTCVV